MYAYCFNNPINKFDPTGQGPWDVFNFVVNWLLPVAVNTTVKVTTGEQKNVAVAAIGASYEVTRDNHYNGNQVNTLFNMVTYNYYPSNKDIYGWLGHGAFDVIPWIAWGNAPNDPTSAWQRFLRFCGIYP